MAMSKVRDKGKEAFWRRTVRRQVRTRTLRWDPAIGMLASAVRMGE